MNNTQATDNPRAGPLPVYVLAEISIHDRERYDRYASRFLQVLQAHQGVLLAADEEPVVVEGCWQRDKVVLVSFPDRDRYHRWASSADYQQIAADRIASTEGTVLLVRSLTGANSAARQ